MSIELSNEDKKQLLDIARKSIAHGVKSGERIYINVADYPEHLQALRATFVTLHIHGQLRGCIGTLEAYQPLIADVAHNAHSAAFLDPRFIPLMKEEFPELNISISILNPTEEVTFTSEEDLLAKIRPGVDGLILSEGSMRGTFLPSVWESLPEPQHFLKELKRKAGLPANYWSNTISVKRYTTTSFH